MRSNSLNTSIPLVLGGGLVLLFSIAGAPGVQSQAKWPLYLPIVAHQANAGPLVPGDQVTPDAPAGTTTPMPGGATAMPEPTAALGTAIATSASTPVVSPTPSPQSTIPPISPPGGLWLTRQELANLPTAGDAWDNLNSAANARAGQPDLSDQDTDANVRLLAKALVYARTGQFAYRTEILNALKIVTDDQTEDGGRTLALGRELAAYVIAADLIDLRHVDADLDARFRNRLRELLTKPLEGWGSDQRTLQQTHELRPNNWGTHAGASRAAIAVYLGDQAELARTAQVFHGYLGDLAAYNGFEYDDDLTWQANPGRPVAINPAGATKDGHHIDGALPEEMRRGGSFQWPPKTTNYPWEGLQGAFLQAEILARAGYPVWEWEDRALLRAMEFLYSIGWPAEGDDEWIPWVANKVYGTDFPTVPKAQPGKNVGWTDWTHGRE